MTACLKCGANNVPANVRCDRCDLPLPSSGAGTTLTGDPGDAPPARAPGLSAQSTLFGVAPGPPAGPASHRAPEVEGGQQHSGQRSELAAQRTLLGVMPPELARALAAGAPQPKPPAARATPPDGGGFSPVGVGSTLSSGTSSAPPGSPEARAGSAAPNAWIGPSSTPPGRLDATAWEGNPRAENAAAAAAGDPAPQLPAAHPVAHLKTHLGVALPGIAPLRPGVSSAPPAPATSDATPLDTTRLHPETQPDSFGVPPRPRLPRSALVLLGSGLVLLLCAAAFALLWSGSKPLSVAVSADATGKDRIDVVCESCPDGTWIGLGEARAEVHDRKAYLTPSEPLPLGENSATFSIRRPGKPSEEEVELSLPPVEYRIRPDTATLSGDPPRLTLRVEALAGSQVRIGQAPVALDGAGRGESSIEVLEQLRGAASEVSSLEQTVPYAITSPSGREYRGELRVTMGITPLILEAPGSDTITDMERFMLAGRTAKGAELWAAGNSIPVDEAGRFAQLMSIDSVGETRVSVRASQSGLAPRIVDFRLQRVDDLRREASLLRQQAVAFATVAEDVAGNLGRLVFVSGKIAELRVDGHRSVVVLQVGGDCRGASCLVRLVYGGLRKLERGLEVTAIGRLQRTGSSRGPAGVPEIEVSLLL